MSGQVTHHFVTHHCCYPLQCFRAADDVQKFFRDDRLTGAVRQQRQALDLSLAFLVALVIAVMRAPNSEAMASNKI